MRRYYYQQEYTSADFGDYVEETPVKIAAEKKINMLRDMKMLHKKRKQKGVVIVDPKEEPLRALLLKCKDEEEMTQMLNNVVRYKETLQQMIDRRTMMDDLLMEQREQM